MAETPTSVEIPHRSLFKAAEVCELMQVQPYVLRSWEAEFPELGVSKGGGPRVYRRSDVENVARIKHLVLVEGLTLAGVRRRLDEEEAPVAVDRPVIDDLIGQNTRERLTEVKRGLRSILEMLSRSDLHVERLKLGSPRAAPSRPAPAPASRAKSPTTPARGKARPKPSNSARRKRSA